MIESRRNLLKAAGGAILASSVIGSPIALAGLARDRQKPGESGGAVPEQAYTLPALPYPPEALEPYIDAETMSLHHDKHHAGYVNGLNKAEAALTEIRQSGDYSLIQHWERQLAFHGAGHFLHSLFWKVMAKPGTTGVAEPYGMLAGKINHSFGNFDSFKAQFSAAAKSVEGSGWAVLAYRPLDDKLVVHQVENHQKLSQMFTLPVLCLDVWEHAYYLKYRNKRADYVDAWWNVVNWPEVEENLKTAM